MSRWFDLFRHHTACKRRHSAQHCVELKTGLCLSRKSLPTPHNCFCIWINSRKKTGIKHCNSMNGLTTEHKLWTSSKKSSTIWFPTRGLVTSIIWVVCHKVWFSHMTQQDKSVFVHFYQIRVQSEQFVNSFALDISNLVNSSVLGISNFVNSFVLGISNLVNSFALGLSNLVNPFVLGISNLVKSFCTGHIKLS